MMSQQTAKNSKTTVPLIFTHQNRIKCFVAYLVSIMMTDKSDKTLKETLEKLQFGNNAVIKCNIKYNSSLKCTQVELTSIYEGDGDYPKFQTNKHYLFYVNTPENNNDGTFYLIRHGVGKHNNMKKRWRGLSPVIKLLWRPTDAMLEKTNKNISAQLPGMDEAITALNDNLNENYNKQNLKLEIFSSVMRRCIETAFLFINQLDFDIVGDKITILDCLHEVDSTKRCEDKINSGWRLFSAAENRSICASNPKKICNTIQDMLAKGSRSEKEEEVVKFITKTNMSRHKKIELDWDEFLRSSSNEMKCDASSILNVTTKKSTQHRTSTGV